MTSRGSTYKSNVIVWSTFILLSMFYLCHSNLGTYNSFGGGVDWAHTMTLIETFYNEGQIEWSHANLEEMAYYPPFCHWLVAHLAQFLALSPLQSLQIVCALFFMLGSLLLAWQYWRDFGAKSVSLLIVSASLLLFAGLGYGFRGMVVLNSAFPQMVGTTCALALFLIFQRMLEMKVAGITWAAIGFIVLGMEALLFVHAMPALWFLIAAVCHFMLTSRPTVGKIVIGLSVLLVAGFGCIQNPYFRNMVMISSNDGVVATCCGHLTTRTMHLVLATIVGLVGAFGIYLLVHRVHLGQYAAAKYAGLMSVLVLVYTQYAAQLLGFGSPYAVKKWFSLLGLWLPYAAGFVLEIREGLPGKFQERGWKFNALTDRRWLARSAVILWVYCCSLPFVTNRENQQELITIRNTLIQWRYKEMVPRKYPQFGFRREVNYYLAIGVLGFPRDDRTMKWFVEGARGEASLQLSGLAEKGP